MKKGLLLASAEELTPEVEEDEVAPVEPGDIEAAMIAVMEAEKEVDKEVAEVKKDKDKKDDLEASVERLEAIRDTIVKYGICAPMMEAADPCGELVAAGIVGSYESLSDVPVKDETATAAVEAIGDVIKSAYEKIKSLVGKLVNKMKDLGVSWSKLSANYLSTLEMNEKHIASLTIDPEIFKTKDIRAISKDDFNKISSVLSAYWKDVNMAEATTIVGELVKFYSATRPVMADVEALKDRANKFINNFDKEDYKKFIGIAVEDKGKDRVSEIKAIPVKYADKRATTAELGWESGDVSNALKEVIGIVTASEKIFKQELRIENLAVKLASNPGWGDEVEDKEEAIMFRSFTWIINDVLNAIIDMCHYGMRAEREVCSTALQLAIAAGKSKQK